MAQGTVSRDVQDELLSKRPRRRNLRGGAANNGSMHRSIPYPARSSMDLYLYDSWDYMFMSGVVCQFTVHKFDPPPRKVLDIGCGNGIWVIEAAKKWMDTQFVGIDLEKCQPDLTRPEYELENYSQRIEWQHIDFLEPLPFATGEFDFVRFCVIGLAVPEDEWQYLIEECARVLAPNGVLEAIEEDLIFPSGDIQKGDDHSLSPISPATAAGSSFAGSTSSLISSPLSFHSSEQHVGLIAPRITPSNSVDSASSQRSILQQNKSLRDRSASSRDHHDLYRAWEGMLHRRFIAPNIIAVLPFYLSTYFDDVQMLPAMHILLPPNSAQSTEGYVDSHFHFGDSPGMTKMFLDLQTHGSRWSTERAENSSSRSKQATKSATVSSWASIHLAKTIQKVRACKEAIWLEYKYQQGDGKRVSEENLREDFLRLWDKWEEDMKDRMSMRAKLNEALAWIDPTGNDQPDWKVWREHAGEMELSEITASYIGPENLCRSLRAFACYKPTSKNIGGR
ncbi:uncharacterized protein FIBRA_02131 [Fibroporia radiculosa]|uniref:Methyltransferase domain-containing protein n=1 Tax=Fibroporia radiculosa TaxID=599839 RepID=J4H1N9_9APHY|nr:uncharacterized protein FIBRA_02131 [Fibroporia radiculosa]CCM00104.1 predicted protein [Fibroporia radiculosa]